uniref:Uncharacterized protein n=1 Tax=Avena sativa TaxID=4498 RepID=A0ACD5U200_AVESA
MAQRARWTSQYEKGLVDVLTEYKFSHYRGQNGWTSEGWNQIVKDLNDHFPEAKFVKSQVQDKEGQMKKEYKVVKSIVNRSGISWNSTSCMINTTPEKWEEIVEEDPKFRRLQGKEFPFFDALDLLYEGNIAQGKHCMTSSQPPYITSRKRQSDERQSTSRNVAPKISAMTSQRFSEDEGQNRFSEVERTSASGRSLSYQSQNDDELNPQGGEEDEDVQRSFDQENSRSGNGGAQSARARKHMSHTSVPVPRIEETMSEFVKLKREQAGIKEQASGKQYSIPKCLEVLNVMVDVSDEIKILASDVFKDASNRELFLSYDPRLRGLWLKKEVGKLGIQLPPFAKLMKHCAHNEKLVVGNHYQTWKCYVPSGCQVQVFRSPSEFKSSEIHPSSKTVEPILYVI